MSTVARRSTGAVPWPSTTRAETIRVSSCSMGKKTPMPMDITIVHSTETLAMSGLDRLWPATPRWT